MFNLDGFETEDVHDEFNYHDFGRAAYELWTLGLTPTQTLQMFNRLIKDFHSGERAGVYCLYPSVEETRNAKPKDRL